MILGVIRHKTQYLRLSGSMINFFYYVYYVKGNFFRTYQPDNRTVMKGIVNGKTLMPKRV